MKSKLNAKTTMYEELIKNKDNYSDYTAITCNQNKIKYSSFINKIDEYANSFYKMGINELETVTIILPNLIDTLVSIYALNKIGAICNIMHYLSSEEEIRKSVNETKSHYIITDENKLKFIKELCDEEYIYNIIYISVNDILTPFDKIKNIFKSRTNLSVKYMSFYRCRIIGKSLKKEIKTYKNQKNIALIINSNSKKIYISNYNINYYANNYNIDKYIYKEGLKIFTDNSIINNLPIYHRALLSGQNIILNPYNNPKLIIDYILNEEPNILEISSNILEKICINRKMNRKDLSFIKLIICEKDTLSDASYQKIKKFFNINFCDAKIITSYGMLETTSNFTYNSLLDSKIDSVGIPIKDMCVKIINVDNDKLCKVNETGRICISGPLLTEGTYKKDSDGKEWLYSDDIGHLDEDGYLYFKSCLKRVITSDGVNIYPEEIEKIIKKHDYVKDVSIVGFPHPYKKEVVKAYIVLKDKYVLNSEIKKSIKEYCEKNVAKYALPYAYAYRKELPKNAIGKVAYSELINTDEEE